MLSGYGYWYIAMFDARAQSLSKSLKCLHLACDDVFLLIHERQVNKNEMPPISHSLNLPESRLREENLENLPFNLIELYVTSPSERIELSVIFGELPTIITTLSVGFNIMNQWELENDLSN